MRELRNDATHRGYEKAPDESLWRMAIGRCELPSREFAERCGAHLTALAELVERA